MLRSLLRTLRQPRYAALTMLMIIVAAACVAAGTWQVSRLERKVSVNDQLRHNAHAPVTTVADVLRPVGAAHVTARHLEFRALRATGTYDAENQWLVRCRSIGDTTGYLILTPLRTSEGTLLVVRGFIPETSQAVPAIPAPPSGTVTIVARAHPGETSHDHAGTLAGRQVESVNPREQSARLGTTVFDGYVALEKGQPGVKPLVPIPSPDLSNPAGGAVEPQHVAYVIQWYLFALLALAAPIAMARAETRHHQIGDIDDAPRTATVSAEQARAAKLADRYGRAVR